MIVSLIVAMDLQRGIGKNNQMPWHISSDLKKFKQITMGHHIVMGRKTYESIGRNLPGRKMIVLSNRRDYEIEGATVFHSIHEAIQYAEDEGETEVFIIGGGEIFEQTLPYAERLYLTMIDACVDADIFFPSYAEKDWEIIHNENINKINGDQYSYAFMILERKK